MAVVVAEHEHADAQRGGRSGRERERDHRRGRARADEVIVHEQRRVAHAFDATSLLGPRRATRQVAGGDAEAERLDHWTPVEPKPKVSRPVVSSTSTSFQSTTSTCWITSCAMRSPRSTTNGTDGSVLSNSTLSSPRYCGSIRPGVLRQVMPCFSASPERG